MVAVALAASLAGCTRPNPAYYPQTRSPGSDASITGGAGGASPDPGTGGQSGAGAGGGGAAGGGAGGGGTGGRPDAAAGGAGPGGSGAGGAGAGGSGAGGAGAGAGGAGAGGTGTGGAGAGGSGAGGIPVPGDLKLHWSFDEGGATGVVSDRSGNLNDGGALGAPLFPASGVPGAASANLALAFDAVDNTVFLPAARNLPAMNRAMTVCFWIYALNTDVRGTVTVMALLDLGGSGLHIGYYGAVPAVWVAGATRVFLTHRRPPAPGWHHIAYTSDGSNHAIYVDGLDPVTSGQSTSTAPISVVRLAPSVTGEPLFGGQLDDVRIYARILGAAEITQLARGF